MSIIRRVLGPLAVSVLVCSAAFCHAAAPSKTEDPSYASEPYVVEQLRTTVRFEADGKGQKEQILRVRVQSESAVREFGLLVYPYMASFETLDVVYVRVRKPDGTVVETPASEIQELDSAVSRQAPMYTDQREKHIAVKSLSVGDKLEVDLRWTAHEAMAPGHFWFDYNFFEGGICLDEQVEVNVPGDVTLKVSSAAAAPEIKQDGARKIYSFHSAYLHRAPEKSEDEKIPAWEANFYGLAPPTVQISSFASWADVGAWYGGLQQSRVQVTPRIRSTAEDIIKGKTTDEEKIRALYEYVATRIRYIGIDLGAGRYTPHAAEDVLNNRYGDCKDKHTLLAALLESVGLHAYPALISSKFKIDADLPTGSVFDHVITAIPQGDSYIFLDTTPEVAPFRLLLAPLRARQALVMPGNSPAKLIVTPSDPPAPNREEFHMDASINDKGTLDGKARFEDRGDPELVLRLAYRNTPQNKWNELMQAISGGMGFGGAVSNVAAEQPEKTSEPFWFTYDYHRADYSDWKERRISLPYPPLFLQELNEAQKKSKEALPLGSQQEFFYKASLKLPEGVQPITPSVVELKNDFAEYTSTYAFQGGVLVGTRHLITKVREVPGAQRAEYSAFVKQMEDDIQQWIILFGDFEQGSALHKGQALLSQGKFSDAVALLQKAQGEDANDKQIALALGTAYSRLPDEAKANAVFDKLIADKPDVATLNAVAYEYATANRRLGDALDYASRAVAQTSKESLEVSLKSAAPDDFLRMKTLAEEWDTLGWIKFRTGNYAEAEKYLESSYSLWPRPLVGQHLANTYEKLGKKREASNICRALLSVPLFQQEPQIQDELVAIQRRIGALPPEPPSTKGKSSNSDQFLLAEDSARTFKMPRKVDFTGKSKIARFKVAIQAEPVSPVVEYISGDLEMRDEAAELAKVNFRQPFPKEYPAKIIRAGWVSCSKFTNDCTLIFFPIADKPSYDSFTKDVE